MVNHSKKQILSYRVKNFQKAVEWSMTNYGVFPKFLDEHWAIFETESSRIVLIQDSSVATNPAGVFLNATPLNRSNKLSFDDLDSPDPVPSATGFLVEFKEASAEFH